jgi:hypothetical protein
MMNNIAITEKLMGTRPCGATNCSMPHSNGDDLTGFGRLGPTNRDKLSKRPQIRAPNKNVMRSGSILIAALQSNAA